MNIVPALGLRNKSLLRLADISDEQMLGLVDFAIALKARKRAGEHLQNPLLKGRNICLVFQKSSTRTRCATVVAVRDEGGNAEYLGQSDIHFGKKESVKDSARVLGRLFDGILFRGFAHSIVEELAENAGVPVWNGLTDEWHPTQILADLQTIKEHFGILKGLKLAFVGDGRNNVCNSLMIGCAKAGIDVVDVCPPELSPDPAVLAMAEAAAARHGSTVSVSHDPAAGVRGANILYTDVWVSMGEEAVFQERLQLLRPFQVNMDLVRATGNLDSGRVMFLHCLPAFHDNSTDVSKTTGALEVTDDVFEAPFSKVFDEAENRMHTIKAMILSSLA
ncbi:ornithine carbamoyltransferase [Oligosphaera ethanolica]|jgi:ornithine carbamoyltransferase|uniref:Ornithine carbamoyltransferase n=1 Tax=Oligosphaera ethanolica TaxID=760260 RepID=A0AAE3VGC0_9BACT|nr:ornithine carbamoyltransferase [Oligosphaera ethanolica]MDI9468718.1 ornithine carbamoyltransferase [Bacillota bacterium]MDQ0289968.1 ornithine carbamoyltransferase [Oligosphaera ethanolica]